MEFLNGEMAATEEASGVRIRANLYKDAHGQRVKVCDRVRLVQSPAAHGLVVGLEDGIAKVRWDLPHYSKWVCTHHLEPEAAGYPSERDVVDLELEVDLPAEWF